MGPAALPPNPIGSLGVLAAAMEVDGEKKAAEEKSNGREGSMLLGLPSFEDIGNGRLRCVETGHELPAREAETYGRSKSCRLAMIDASIEKKKPPVNTFKPDPLSKSKIICKLTGDVINKTEEHIWKHISGRRFMHKLEQKEMEKSSPTVQKNESMKEKKLDPIMAAIKKCEKEAGADHSNDAVSTSNGGEEEEEDYFWMPPVGERWDFDDGKDRWGSSSSSSPDTDDDVDGDGAVKMDDEVDSGELSIRTKRMSIAVGPSSFASKKKKSKKSSAEHPIDD